MAPGRPRLKPGRLNANGYGQGDSAATHLDEQSQWHQLQQLTPCDEARWKAELQDQAGVHFDRLIGLNNMPIARFLQQLQADGHVNCCLKLLQAPSIPERSPG